VRRRDLPVSRPQWCEAIRVTLTQRVAEHGVGVGEVGELVQWEGALVGVQGAAGDGPALTCPAATSRRTLRISSRVAAGHQFGQ
jgi:hypothetical protein